MLRAWPSGLPPLPAGTWESCEICHFGHRSRDLREVHYDGRRVKACPSCRARIWQENERRRREKGEIQGGQLMW